MRLGKALASGVALAAALTAFAGASSASATTLCKVAMQEPCAAGNRWAAETEFKSSLLLNTEARIVTTEFEVTCEASQLGFKTTEQAGSPLKGEITQLTFAGCRGKCTTVTAIRLNYKTELEWTAVGNGSFTAISGGAGNPALKLTNCTGGATCVFKAEAVGMFFGGGQPAEVKPEAAPFGYESGLLIFCGAEATLTATYTVNSAQEPGAMEVANPRVMVAK
jgi:hypothetical protein